MLGRSEETFDHKLGNFEKRASDLVLISRCFQFYFTEVSQSQIKIH